GAGFCVRRQEWVFEELEYTFLRRAPLRRRGASPAPLGPDYPAVGERMLLERSERLERENKPDAALASADVLLRLAPRSTRAHNRLALLYHKRGKLEPAGDLLLGWRAQVQGSAVPRPRLAGPHHQLGPHPGR